MFLFIFLLLRNIFTERITSDDSTFQFNDFTSVEQSTMYNSAQYDVNKNERKPTKRSDINSTEMHVNKMAESTPKEEHAHDEKVTNAEFESNAVSAENEEHEVQVVEGEHEPKEDKAEFQHVKDTGLREEIHTENISEHAQENQKVEMREKENLQNKNVNLEHETMDRKINVEKHEENNEKLEANDNLKNKPTEEKNNKNEPKSVYEKIKEHNLKKMLKKDKEHTEHGKQRKPKHHTHKNKYTRDEKRRHRHYKKKYDRAHKNSSTSTEDLFGGKNAGLFKSFRDMNWFSNGNSRKNVAGNGKILKTPTPKPNKKEDVQDSSYSDSSFDYL